MIKTLYFAYFAIIVIALIGFALLFSSRADTFAQAMKIMEVAQSQSLAAWELSDSDFQLLTDAYDESFVYMFDTVGHHVSEDGITIDTTANPDCQRCFHVADLRDTVSGEKEVEALLAHATLHPEEYEEYIDQLISRISTNSRQQSSIRELTDDINTWTHDARLRIRFIRWFYEYRDTRELGPAEEVLTETEE